jgi:hypothetical protein
MIIPVLKMIKPKFSVLLTFSCLFQNVGDIETHFNSSLFDEFVCKLDLFWHAWAILKRE